MNIRKVGVITTILFFNAQAIGMDNSASASIFSIQNETRDLIELVVTNGNEADKYIKLQPSQEYSNHRLNKNSETIFHVFRREKTPKGKYEASWSIAAGTDAVHIKLKQTVTDQLFIRPNLEKQQKPISNIIRKIL